MRGGFLRPDWVGHGLWSLGFGRNGLLSGFREVSRAVVFTVNTFSFKDYSPPV